MVGGAVKAGASTESTLTRSIYRAGKAVVTDGGPSGKRSPRDDEGGTAFRLAFSNAKHPRFRHECIPQTS